MTQPDASPRTRRFVRLLVVVGGLAGAVMLAPIGTDVTAESTDPIVEETPAPSKLSEADRRTLELGLAAEGVGRPSPEIAFNTFDGTPVELHGRTRPVVLLFLDDPCTECDSELGRLAVAATILFDEAWTAVLSSPVSADDVRTAVAEAGAAELIFAGTDEGDGIARSFGVERTPATIVVDGEGRVAAVWQRPIPAAVVIEVVRGLSQPAALA